MERSMEEMHAMMSEMNKKMDMMMEHMGCKSMPKEDYMAMSDDEKDNKDENDMKKMTGM